MNTSVNNNNIESNNRVINYDIEIVRDFDGTYYVNARNELHEHIKGLPEYLSYKELKKTVKEALGVTLPPLKCLTFEGDGRKQYANAYGLHGIEIHQEALAFGLQDKVVLGSFGESRPYAIGCTVTGYRWDSEAGEFLYILQGDDGKDYADFARNIIPDNGNDPKGDEKATLETTSEITASSEQGINVGTEVWTTIELHEEYGKRGKVVRRFFADHGVWCLDIEFEDGTKATYAEEYVTTKKPWAVVGARCKHKYLNRDVVLTITAVGQYYGIKAESEDGKVKRCGLVRDFEPVEDVKEADFSDTLADDLKEGDRVLSRHYGAKATVLGREWDKQRKAWYYRVQFDTMQRNTDGSEFNVTEFHRDGLTKNYDPVTCSERVGNAEYYRETLLAEFWGNDRTPRTVFDMEIFKPTDRRPSWLVVADIFSEPKEMTLREVCDMLAARYQEEQGDAA